MQLCQIHNCEITRIILKLDNQSVQLVCEECIEDQGLQTQLHQQVLLQKVKKQAEELLSKINIDSTVKSFLSKLLKATEDDLKSIKRLWKDRLEKIQQILAQLIMETESYFDQLIKDLEEFRRGLVNIVNFGKFKQLISDDQQPNKESLILSYIKELENEITGQKKTDILNLIQNYKDKIKSTPIPLISDRLNFISNELNAYQLSVKDNSLKCNPEINPQNPQFPIYQPTSKILLPKNLEKLIERIVKQKKYTIQQIYSANFLQGLSSDSFWNNINNKNNLLMIFRSKNKVIFGGYSPCVWNKQIQQGINDATYTSFLYVQNGEDLKFFPIKKENKPAILCNPLSGPNFGNDLIISADFQGGSLNLGNTYQSDIPPGQPQFLFGSQNQPNINECEIISIQIQ